MSHFTTVKTHIRDLRCLKQALTDLGYTFQEGNLMIEDYFQNKLPVSVLVSGLPRSVGFQKSGEEYDIVGDWWGMEKLKPEFENKVLPQYAYRVVEEKIQPLMQQGFTLAEERDTEKNLVLVLQR